MLLENFRGRHEECSWSGSITLFFWFLVPCFFVLFLGFFPPFLSCCLKGYDLRRKREGGDTPHSQKERFSNEQILIRDQIMKMPEFSGFQILGLLTCALGFPRSHPLSCVSFSTLALGNLCDRYGSCRVSGCFSHRKEWWVCRSTAFTFFCRTR